MASYAALVSLENTLGKFIRQDQLQILDHEDKRRSFNLLMQNVAVLLEFLNKFPGSARQLEKRIGDFANEAENIIENHVWEARFNGKVSLHGSSKLFLDIKNIAAEIESIIREAEGNKSNGIAERGSRSEDEPLSLRESGIRKNKDKVVGFDDELVRVKDRILYGNPERVAITIVGMGGVGKTTLARATFDDPAVVRRFDVRRWVTVSQIYDPRAILRAILNEDSSDETASVQDLSIKVHQLLHKRRYIIVVDDVWNPEPCDGVKMFLPDDGNHSRVLLTTRDENVASYASGSSTVIHHLSLMDKERSWRLLEQRVFGEGACCPPELVKLGETIAEGCKGLPLAIVVIAGILSNSEQTPDSWERIAKDVNMTLSKGGEFSEILSLSYYHLPHFLKPCFLYFGAYPEDYDIHVSELVKLWIAEGFLKLKPAKPAEEIAYGCLEDLTMRNLIMVSKKRYNGDIKKCRIHDLLRQFCITQAEEEKFIYHANDTMKLGIILENISNARRVSFSSSVSIELMNLAQCSVHTALCFKCDQHLISQLLPCRLFRVLDISAVKSRTFSSEIFQLYHLRYLAFTLKVEKSFELPKDICNLENLGTLIANLEMLNIHHCNSMILPPEFWTMTSLRHVRVNWSVVLPDPISQRFPLENLRTVSKIYNFRCTEEVVKLLPNVRSIEVAYNFDCENESWYDFNLNNFGRFINLDCLRFEFHTRVVELGWCERNPFLECLVFPSSLRRLYLHGETACIPWENVNAALGPLPNLESLKLWQYVCSGDVWETREGNFQNLRELQIYYCDLKCWITESPSHLPSLEKLVLCCCYKLTVLPDCIGEIPTLQRIKIDKCLEAVADWARRIREEQLEIGNELLNIEVEQVDQLRDLKKDVEFAEQLVAFLPRLINATDALVADEELDVLKMKEFEEEWDAGVELLKRLGFNEDNKPTVLGQSIMTKLLRNTSRDGETGSTRLADFFEDMKSYLLEPGSNTRDRLADHSKDLKSSLLGLQLWLQRAQNESD